MDYIKNALRILDKNRNLEDKTQRLDATKATHEDNKHDEQPLVTQRLPGPRKQI